MGTPNGSSRNFVPMHSKFERIILLVDMDCFYCQVEEKLNPSLKGQPLAVVQYNAWRGGGIIAVNYAARALGVTRHMRGDEAREQCPDIVLVKVPNVREKADLSKYREAGKEVANVLQRFTQLLERASVDEAYLDVTDSVNKRIEQLSCGTFMLKPQELFDTYAVGYSNIGEYINGITKRFVDPYINDDEFLRFHELQDLPTVRQSDIRLFIGASIAGEIRAAVKSETGYECSAGIAHNKILAKLACSINKPNKQTILPLTEIPRLFETLVVSKIQGLGGKFGEEVCERLNIKYLGQLLKFTEAELQRKFDEKNGTWLYYIARGIDLGAVTPRFYSKSIGCCKKFPGGNKITDLKTLQHWLKELAEEICERLEKDRIENNRKARQMVVSFIQEYDAREISSSRSAPLINYDQELLAKYSLDVIKSNTKTFFRPGSEIVLNNPLKFLGISVGKFETISNAQIKLQNMFINQETKKRKVSDEVSMKEPNIPEGDERNCLHTLNEQISANLERKSNEKQGSFTNPTDPTSHLHNMLKKQQKSSMTSKTELCTSAEDVTKTIATSFIKVKKPTELTSFFLSTFKKQQENDLTNQTQRNTESEISYTPALPELKIAFKDDLKMQDKITSANETQTTNENDINCVIEIETNKSQQIELNEMQVTLDESAKSPEPKNFFLSGSKNQQAIAKYSEILSVNTNLKSSNDTNTNEHYIPPAITEKSPEKMGNSLNVKPEEKTNSSSLFPENLKQTNNIFDETKQDEILKNLVSNKVILKPNLENMQNTLDAATRAEFQIQMLSGELEEIESSSRKTNSNHESTSDKVFRKIFENTQLINSTHLEKINFKRKLNDDNCSAGKDTQNDYCAYYAEYAVPEIRPELLKYIKCEQCGAQIIDDAFSLQTHQDHHLAKQLSHQQREEYRRELKNKLNSTIKSKSNTRVQKKAKRANISASNGVVCKADITKFFKLKTTTTEIYETDTNSLTPTELCTECQTYVKITDLTEHMDFHLAKQLQRKINQLEVRTVTGIKKPTSTAAKKSLNNSTNKTIVQFFTPKS